MSGFRRQKSKEYESLKKAINDLDSTPPLKVGFFDTKYEDGTPVAYVASIHEFGSSQQGIPPRSFMRTTALEKASSWNSSFKSGFKAIGSGGETLMSVLDKMGFVISGDIAKKISQISAPPLKPSTIKAKQRKLSDTTKTGSLGKPLVETGLMINSVTHKVGE